MFLMMRTSLQFFFALAAPSLIVSAQTCDLGTGGYYDGVDVTDSSALHNLLQQTHQEVPFSAHPGNDVWDVLKDLDGDASGTLIRLIYKDTEHDNTPNVAASYNREHLWPRTKGVGYNGLDYSDIHAIRAAFFLNKAVRGDRYFSSCGLAHPQSECTSPAGSDFADTTEIDETTFAPPINRRGDIARAIFYMVLRYDGSEAGTADLHLTDCPTGEIGEYGYLSQLLHWHVDDPVDTVEQARNDKACQWQGNRNPFVDHPNLVQAFFGSPRPTPGDGQGYDCSTTTTTTTAPPTTTTSSVALQELLHETDFEYGWDGWVDGGWDAYRSNLLRACTGSYCIRIRDDTVEHSSMTRDFGDLTSYDELKVDFSYYAIDMDDGEKFHLEISNDKNDTASWINARTWVAGGGDDFINEATYHESVIIQGSILPGGSFGNTVSLRLRCDASENDDAVYIDDVSVMGIVL